MEAPTRRANFIERNDWKVWAVLSAIIAMSGLGDIQIGGSTYARDQAVLLDVATRRSTLQAVP